jgi:cell division protease FtsH
VDEETRQLIDAAHQAVTRLLGEHRDQLESLTQALLKAETLDALDAYTAAGVTPHQEDPAPAVA